MTRKHRREDCQNGILKKTFNNKMQILLLIAAQVLFIKLSLIKKTIHLSSSNVEFIQSYRMKYQFLEVKMK